MTCTRDRYLIHFNAELQRRLQPNLKGYPDRKPCLEGTRVKEISQIIAWLLSNEKQILLLHGVAGCGKSTVATTIETYFRAFHRLGAFICFKRNETFPGSVICTVAYKLAVFDSNINEYVTAVDDSDILSATSTFQFEKLLLLPLQAAWVKGVTSPFVIILEALDEFGDQTIREPLLKIIFEMFSRLPKNCRILVTARSEYDIISAAQRSSSVVDMMILDHGTESSREDVLRYLEHEMTVQRQLIPKDLDEHKTLRIMASSANGLFIWASTAVAFVANPPHRSYNHLQQLLAQKGQPLGLETLYETALASSGLEWNQQADEQLFRSIMSILMVSKDKLTEIALSGLIPEGDISSLHTVLRMLGCLIMTSENTSSDVGFLHASFPDYLTSKRAQGKKWYISLPDAHEFMTIRILSVMKKLHFNMASLRSSYLANSDVQSPSIGARVKSIPAELLYCCKFWGEHLSDHLSNTVDKSSLTYKTSDTQRELAGFLRVRWLFWAEMLTLDKKEKLILANIETAMRWLPEVGTKRFFLEF